MPTRQEFDTVDVLRLEVEKDPTGLVNLVQNPSGALGGWGWITTIAGSKMASQPPSPGVQSALRYDGVAGASYFTSEYLPVAAGQYVAARWYAAGGDVNSAFRARFEWINSAGAVISSSAQTGYLLTYSAAGNLGAQLAPAGTVWARLRFDLYKSTAGATHTGAHYFALSGVTVAKSATSGTLGQSRANLVPNPSFVTDALGWFSSTATVARSTAQSYIGSGSLLYTHGATEGGSFWSLTGRRGMPVTGGATYAVSARTRAATTPRTWRLYAQWYNAAGTYVGSSTSLTATNNTTGWTSVSGTVTAPASAAYMALDGEVSAVSGEQHYWDAFMVEQASSVGSYFDSTTTDAGGWDYGGNLWPPLVITRTNLVPNPAPTSTTGYTASDGTLLAFESGTLKVYPTDSRTDTFASVGGDIGALRLGMVAGKTYTVSAELVGSNYGGGGDPTRIDSIVVHHRIGTGAYTILSTGPGLGRKSISFTLPAGTTEAFVRLYNGGRYQFPNGSTFSAWRKVMLEEGSAADPYFDGSTADATADYTFYDRAWTGTANNSTSTETQTTNLPYATAVNSTLGYVEPVQFLNVLQECHSIRTVRQALNVGTLSAEVLSTELDPSNDDLIRPGRRCRLLALDTNLNSWTPLFTGEVSEASVSYELKDLSVPEQKRARIVLTAIDATSKLANQKRSEGVTTVAELPYVLEGCGVPWNVNGSGNQVPTATVVAYNDNASALDQIAVTRDTNLAYAWVDRNGVAQVWEATTIERDYTPYLDQNIVTDFGIAYNTQDCINEVTIKFLRLNPATGDTEEVPYGPYRNEASINEWGVRSADFTIQGLSEETSDIADFAAAVLAANSNPEVRINSVTCAASALWMLDQDYLLADLMDFAYVEMNTPAAYHWTEAFVSALEHNITPEKWTVEFSFLHADVVASPTFTPSPTLGAGGKTIGQLLRPLGEVTMWYGAKADCPPGWLVLDGTTFSSTTYPDLAAFLGGTTLPNMTDRLAIGAGTKALGTTGGSPSINVDHTHQKGSTLTNVAPSPSSYVVGTGNWVTGMAATGQNTTFDVTGPWRALWFIIRAV